MTGHPYITPTIAEASLFAGCVAAGLAIVVTAVSHYALGMALMFLAFALITVPLAFIASKGDL